MGNDEYAQFCARILAAMAKRVESGDIEGLVHIAYLASRADDLLKQTARRLVDDGYSWADVGRVLGITRQAAHQRLAA